jgi:hypothetical protein
MRPHSTFEQVSFVDNTVVEGNHVWNYNLNWVPPKPRVPPVPSDPRSITDYHPGGAKALEPWSFAVGLRLWLAPTLWGYILGLQFRARSWYSR